MNSLSRLFLLPVLLLAGGCTHITPSTPPASPQAAVEGAFHDDAHALTARETAVINAGLDPARLALVQHDLLATLLAPASAPAEAQEAAQQLGYVLLAGNRDNQASALASLAPLLADPARVDNARLALDRVPGAAVDQLYLDALPGATGRHRLGLLDSIGTRRMTAAVATLATLLNDSDPATAAGAARALGRIGGPAAVNGLSTARDSLSPVVLNARLAAATDATTRARLAAEIYRNPAAPLAQRSAALRSLIAANPAGAVAVIHDALAGAEPAFHATALESVATLPAAALLADRLGTYPPAVQIPLLAALGHRGDAAARHGVLMALANEDPGVRLAAIEALERLPGNPETARRLATLATGRDDEAKAAFASLSRLNGPGLDKVIHDGAAGNGDPGLRTVFIQQIAARNQTASIPFLLSLRGSPVDALRVEALDALRVIAGPAEQTALIDWITHAPAKAEQTSALRALITLILRQDDAVTRAAPVVAALQPADAAARLALMPVLSRAAGPTALASAGRLALDADPAVATAATAELTRWPDPSVVPVLVDVAVKTPAASIRASAIRGATRFLTQSGLIAPVERSRHVRRLIDLPMDLPARLDLINVLSLCTDQAALESARKHLADPATAARARDAVDAITSALAGPPAFTASHSGDTAALVSDGDTDTCWMVPIVPGEWLLADLHHSRPVRKITLEQGNREWDFPATIDVFVSDDPARPGGVRVQAEGTRYRTVVTLPEGVHGRYLLIRQTGTRSGPWAIAELALE